MFKSFTKISTGSANNCKQGKHTGALPPKIVLACQTFGWALERGNNSTNFPLILLIGPTWASFSLNFNLNKTDISPRILIWYQCSVQCSARTVNLPNFVIVRIKSESSLLLNFPWCNTGYKCISMFFLCSTVLRF